MLFQLCKRRRWRHFGAAIAVGALALGGAGACQSQDRGADAEYPAEPGPGPAEPGPEPAEPGPEPAEPAPGPAEPGPEPAEPASGPSEPSSESAQPGAGAGLDEGAQPGGAQGQGGDVSDDEVKAFASAYAQITQLQQTYRDQMQAAGSDAEIQRIQRDAQKAISDVIEAYGFTSERFDEIARAVQTDPELRQRLEAELSAAGQ